MNALFLIIFIAGGVVLAALSPESFFSALVSGGQKAVNLSLQLAAVYAVSMGFIKIAEDAGLLKKLTRLLSPINKRLFACEDSLVCGYISGNIAANLLGMGGAATPLGINAMQGLAKGKTPSYSQAVFFVVNASGISLLPLSVIALRSAAGAISPSDILLPSILSSAVCLACSLILVNIFVKRC